MPGSRNRHAAGRNGRFFRERVRQATFAEAAFEVCEEAWERGIVWGMGEESAVVGWSCNVVSASDFMMLV